MGQGLSGWVVENGKAIVNGNPAVEPGYAEASGKCGALNSALSIPLGDGVDQLSGALTLYRTEKDAYSADHLRVLLADQGRHRAERWTGPSGSRRRSRALAPTS